MYNRKCCIFNVLAMANSPPVPSSAASGFFQALPTIPSQYTSPAASAECDTTSGDVVLKNILQLYLPSPLPENVDKSLHDFARTCLDSRTLELSVDCETNHPTLHPLTTFGEVNQRNALHTSEGWRGLKDIQTRAGIVGYGYRDVATTEKSYNRRIHQFALAHLWSASCASVSCPAAMSDGAAILLSRRLAVGVASGNGQDAGQLEQVLLESYNRLTSTDPSYAWTSGQWMTERPGGSDLSRTETLAKLASRQELTSDREAHGRLDRDDIGLPLGPYIINGFKWFSSATDADMSILLARTDKGISTFYAPVKRAHRDVTTNRTDHVVNGVRISRLKNKLGTKGLPTAELEIRGMRAWLLGEEGHGIREISAILNCTRLWTACGSVGGWGRALAVTRAYADVRKIKGEQLLRDNVQHVKWMADETIKYRACAHLAFLGVSLLGITESGFEVTAETAAAAYLPRTKEEAGAALRLLTPVMKAQCSLWATWGIRECMESLGGVGYCENNEDGGIMNLARSYRDSAVNSIWEGTTNIIAGDFVRVLKGRSGQESLAAVDGILERGCRIIEDSKKFDRLIVNLVRRIEEMKIWLNEASAEDILYNGRNTLEKVQEIVCAVLLMLDSALRNESEVETRVAEKWLAMRLGISVNTSSRSMMQRHHEDKTIFYGTLQQVGHLSNSAKL